MSATFSSSVILALVLFHSPGQFPLRVSPTQRSALTSESALALYDWTKHDDAERERWKRERERAQEKRKRVHEHWKREDERAREQDKRDDEHWKRLEERAREQDKRDLEQWKRDLR
jgi:hypothetical protein